MQYLAHIRKHDTRKSIQILEEKKTLSCMGKRRNEGRLYYFLL